MEYYIKWKYSSGKPINKLLDWDLKCPQLDNEDVSVDRCGGISRSGLLATADCATPSIFFCEKPVKGTYRFKSLRNSAIHNHHKHIQQIIKDEETYSIFLLLLCLYGRTVRNQ